MINATLTINTPSDNSGGLMSRGAGGAGGAGAGARGPGDVQGQGQGQRGGMDAIVDMLGDTLIQMLFQKKGDGATFDNPGNNPLMDMIADYMDRNPGYHSPDDATGNVRSWKDEMSEDNYLDKQELSDFTAGLKGFLSSLLSGDWSSLGGGGGMQGGGAGLGSASPLAGGPGGGMQGGGAGFGSASPLAGSPGGGMQGGQSPMAQNGFSMGSSFASHVGKTAIDSIDIKQSGVRLSEVRLNGGERFSIDGADKDIAKDVAKFMDQNPEKYGPAPKNGGWAGRIEEGKDFNQGEIDRFKQAMNDLKGVMDGKSTGDQQTDMDAMLASNSIISDSMYKLSA